MLRRSLLPCLLVLAAAPVANAAGPVAHASKACSLSSKEKGGSKPSSLGTTYVTKLTVKHTSCGKGKKVIKAFNACRHKHGAGGRCTSRVRGYSCSEARESGIGQYQSDASCKRGRKSVKFHYVQNT